MKLYQLIDIEKVKFAAKTFNILNHPDRLRIINLLMDEPGVIVKEIRAKLNLRQADASWHLGLLANYGILNYEHRGKFNIYMVNTPMLEKIIKISEEFYNK